MRNGFIYFAQAWEPVWAKWGLLKIGFATDPKRRIQTLASVVPAILHVLFVIPGTQQRERELHKRFDDYREHGEWFLPAKELMHEVEKLRPVNFKMEEWMCAAYFLEKECQERLNVCP